MVNGMLRGAWCAGSRGQFKPEGVVTVRSTCTPTRDPFDQRPDDQLRHTRTIMSTCVTYRVVPLPRLEVVVSAAALAGGEAAAAALRLVGFACAAGAAAAAAAGATSTAQSGRSARGGWC